MSHLSHDTFDALAASYALGALDGDELAEFERHLREGCPRCAATLSESEETLAALARSTPAAITPPQVREALLRRVAASPRARTTSRASWLRWAMGTAAAVVAGAAFTGAYVATRYEARLGQMARETYALRERLLRNEAALREQLAFYTGAVDLLRDPATRVVTLRGAGPAPEAIGRLLWNEASGGHLFVAKLPPAPAGKTYELWTIVGTTPRPAGLFTVDPSGRGSHRVASAPAGAVTGFAVSLEPEGGVQAPTGPIVLASSAR